MDDSGNATGMKPTTSMSAANSKLGASPSNESPSQAAGRKAAGCVLILLLVFVLSLVAKPINDARDRKKLETDPIALAVEKKTGLKVLAHYGEPYGQESLSGDMQDAYYAAWTQMVESLKSPSSANDIRSMRQVMKVEGNRYAIFGCVEAKNIFGVELRRTWTASVREVSGEYVVESLQIDE